MKSLQTTSSRRRKPVLVTAVIGLLLLLAQQFGGLNISHPKTAVPPVGYYTVAKFYDGDTIAVNMAGSEEKVRFIGVDTPETHDPRKPIQCFGKAAAAFTQQLIGSNGVRLEADPINTNRDRYNRLLRYVYLPDGKLVNAEIIRQGYGFAYTAFPFTKAEEFTALAKEARQANRGLWNTCTPTENKNGTFTSNPE